MDKTRQITRQVLYLVEGLEAQLNPEGALEAKRQKERLLDNTIDGLGHVVDALIVLDETLLMRRALSVLNDLQERRRVERESRS